VSRDLAADACGKLTAHQPRERGVAPARVTLSAAAADFPLVQNGH